jgi:hypothetical protein
MPTLHRSPRLRSMRMNAFSYFPPALSVVLIIA